MPMPGRMIRDGKAYRYSFQGQEKDAETGKEAFQLRLWDGRIGRWLTVDPKGTGFSPYVGMGNNPVVNIDPDGGCVVGVDCPPEFDWMGQGTNVLDEVVLGGGGGGVNWTSDAISNGGIYDFSTMSQAGWETTYAIAGMQMTSINAIMKPKPSWMSIAESQIGVKELTNNNDGIIVEKYLKSTGLPKGNAWCGAFVNWSLESAGIDGVEPKNGNHPARALSWRNWGVKLDKPAFGAIATKTRRGGGHVGFVGGVNSDGTIIILGGNQNHSVNYQSYSSNFQFHFPRGYIPNYSIPVINMSSGGSVSEH